MKIKNVTLEILPTLKQTTSSQNTILAAKLFPPASSPAPHHLSSF